MNDGFRLGLALGGGGARGLAHLGVLKVLEAEGLRPDMLAGTSMGGLVACLYACGHSIEHLEAEAVRLSSIRQLLPLTDTAFLRRGLFKGERVAAYLQRLIGDRNFEQLHIPTSVVAVALDDYREIVLNEGSVLDAVRATIAIPGVFAPVERNGQSLVDGGVLNNVPADVVREMGADVVVAVDVMGYGRAVPFPSIRDAVSIPGPLGETLEVLYRVLTIMTRELVRRRLADAAPDLLVEPAVSPDITPLTGFTRARECIAAGEVAMRERLPELLRRLDEAARIRGSGARQVV